MSTVLFKKHKKLNSANDSFFVLFCFPSLNADPVGAGRAAGKGMGEK